MTSPTAALLPITEQDFQGQIIELAHLRGYRVAHFRPAMTARGWRTPISADGAGFPDLVLARPARTPDKGRLICVEVKGRRAPLSEAQQHWNTVLTLAGAEAYIWRVGEITIEQIAEVLR